LRARSQDRSALAQSKTESVERVVTEEQISRLG